MPKKIRELKAMLNPGRLQMATRKRQSHEVGTSPGMKTRGAGGQRRKGRTPLSGRISPRSNRESGTSPQVVSHYSMLIQWSDEDNCFIVTLPEFEDVKTHGDTYEQAVRMGKELIESCILWHRQDGKPLPRPQSFVDSAA